MRGEERVLVFTVDCWNSRFGINTFSALLEDYPPERVANVYLREELPDDKRCARYFQISEQRVIRSVTHRGTETGRTVTPTDIPTDEDKADADARQTLYARGRRSRTYGLRQIARELVWKLGRWHTPALDAFLDDFRPDVILFDMSNYIHMTRMVRYAVRRTGAAAIGYIWDDTFTYRQLSRFDPWRIHRAFNRRALRKAARDCSVMWAITEKTKAEADAFFSTKKHPVSCRVITKPIDCPDEAPAPAPVRADEPVRILYTGNLLIGRMDSVRLLSAALADFNGHSPAPRAVADVYTATPLTPAETDGLPYVTFHPPVPPDEAVRLRQDADILLLCEALDGPQALYSRLSFSTKLTDYLCARRCILAMLPRDTATYEYLSAHGAALCVHDGDRLAEALRAIISDPSARARYADAAYALGRANHDRAHILAAVRDSIDTAIAASAAKRDAAPGREEAEP